MTTTVTANGLSSNWKQLQQKLRAEKQDDRTPLTRPPATTLGKRLASQPRTSRTSHPQAGPPLKRLKTERSSRPKGKMGSYFSTPATPTTDPTTAPPPDPEVNDTSSSIIKYVALDCEMVGTRDTTDFCIPAGGPNHTPTNNHTSSPEYSILARATLTTYTGSVHYDAYALPPPGIRISDYRTRWSGITAQHLDPRNPTTQPKPFSTVQREVAAILKDRILVGHALAHDLAVLGLSHPASQTRDTARHPPFRALAASRPGGKGRTPSLQKLAREVLRVEIQGDRNGHDSAEDARTAMELYKAHRVSFEADAAKRFGRPKVIEAVRADSGGDEGEGSAEEDKKKRKRKKRKKKRAGA